MYDDFMSGYNYGNRQPLQQRFGGARNPGPTVAAAQQQANKIIQQRRPGVYDKSKFTRMQGPAGEQGEIYANGKMYIVAGPGKQQVRTFPSRPYAIKYMMTKGWVLI